ncbi:MAG: hopanoid biosynthesis-associated protein HpnK [Bradyrhizobium sp.]|uniref:hopanoid biosynthesis-associated protein HpnK n=1 Tax=Bradyrhizobium sp. TaxID=376 RepID=UPI001C285387|nr:hopanoid biosynthesis-associated protein HpnK [Bradyrhizobium sp.]MBU6462588.1 hopanoid biosynthesis-associated protein HpnK [Pseudomonadota bacterium]MDE2067209.1 hopanoid biosynthesis-associated protein HpnK [Bradyrhizobium sp.]
MIPVIITADDFGLAEELNEAVEIAHRCGVLSAASLMVGGPAARDALRRAQRLPRLSVGLHLVLADAEPMLSRERIPCLVDSAGRLRKDIVQLAFELMRSPRCRAQMRAEIDAQFVSFARSGLRLDHVSFHKHYHLHPVVGREVVAACRRFGSPPLRVPAEPGSVIRFVEPGSARAATSAALAAWTTLLRAQAHHAGLLVPNAVFGLAWSGQFTTTRLRRLLRHLPSGLVEIYTHPATVDRFSGSVPGYRYSEELAALCAPEVLAEVRRAQIQPTGYSGPGQTACASAIIFDPGAA